MKNGSIFNQNESCIYPKYSFRWTILILLLLMLYSVFNDSFLMITGMSLKQSVYYPTFIHVLFNSLFVVILGFISSPVILIAWNALVAHFFAFPKIRYMHAFLLVFGAYFLYTYINYFQHSVIENILRR